MQIGPAELEVTIDGDSLSLVLDESIYPLDAIYGAAYLFLDRAYLFLARPGPGQVRVHLKSKEERSEQALVDLAGELANELLNQVLRLRIGESTKRIREYYMARALRPTRTPPAIEQLLQELEAEDLADDPLDITVPWEEKYPGQQEPEDD